MQLCFHSDYVHRKSLTIKLKDRMAVTRFSTDDERLKRSLFFCMNVSQGVVYTRFVVRKSQKEECSRYYLLHTKIELKQLWLNALSPCWATLTRFSQRRNNIFFFWDFPSLLNRPSWLLFALQRKQYMESLGQILYTVHNQSVEDMVMTICLDNFKKGLDKFMKDLFIKGHRSWRLSIASWLGQQSPINWLLGTMVRQAYISISSSKSSNVGSLGWPNGWPL